MCERPSAGYEVYTYENTMHDEEHLKNECCRIVGGIGTHNITHANRVLKKKSEKKEANLWFFTDVRGMNS